MIEDLCFARFIMVNHKVNTHVDDEMTRYESTAKILHEWMEFPNIFFSNAKLSLEMIGTSDKKLLLSYNLS